MRNWRRWITAVVLVALLIAGVRHRGEVADAARDIAAMTTNWKLALVALAVAGIATSGLAVRSLTPGLTVLNGVAVHQATTGANNSIVGSGPVNLGLRIAMLRSWGVGPAAIGVTVVALSVVAASKMWLGVLVVAVLGVFGAAEPVLDPVIFAVVGVAAVVVLGASTAWWFVMLRFEVLSSWIARRAQRITDRIRRRVRRLPAVDLPGYVATLRTEGQALVGSRWRTITVATFAEQVVFVLTPVAVVRAVGIDAATVSTAQVLIVFGLVRLAVALTPIPGGLGVTELGLAALLIRFGGPESAVVAAVLVYRMMTFLLPIATGGICLALWRQGDRRRTAERSCVEPHHDPVLTPTVRPTSVRPTPVRPASVTPASVTPASEAAATSGG